MAYIGKGLKSIETANISVDTMTGNGSTTTMDVSLGSKTSISVNDISVFISGVCQRPGTDYTLSGSTITFTTAPENGWKVVALSKGDTWTNEIMDGSVINESIKDGAVTDAKITELGANKLTGALPALDGSALTGIVTYIKSANDPAIDTNPSSGLGTVWVNQVSGNIFLCTDTTTDANVWTNVGPGSGNIEPYSYGGTNYGFQTGGFIAGTHNGIWRFSLTSDGNTTDWADMVPAYYGQVGTHSDTHGYTLGGNGNVNTIEKFPFASQTNASDIADLTEGKTKGASHSTGTHGFLSGGQHASQSNVIEKHSLSADDNATDVGDLTAARAAAAGASSSTHGFTMSGSQGGGVTMMNTIDKFAFASTNNATDVSDTLSGLDGGAGQTSKTHGYVSGGHNGSSYINTIQKVAFNSNNNATDVGDLYVTRGYATGVSGTTHGYTVGGHDGGYRNEIDKFTFAADNNATDVGDIIQGRYNGAGVED